MDEEDRSKKVCNKDQQDCNKQVPLEVWYMVKKRVGICPQCGSDKVVPVIYGMPTSELDDDEKAGKVRLGGCCVSLDSPDLACNNCGLKWSDQGIK